MSSRSRKWCIVCHEKSEVFGKFESVVKNLSKCSYSYILHNNDIEEDGTPKRPHYHCVLSFENARTFTSIANTFIGCHIEPCEFYNLSIQYLIHKNNLEKAQYNINEIVTNYTELELNCLIELDEYEQLTTESLFGYINNGDIYNIVTACEKYGIHQVNRYKGLIKEICEDKKAHDGIECELIGLQSIINDLRKELEETQKLVEIYKISESNLKVENIALKRKVGELIDGLRLC